MTARDRQSMGGMRARVVLLAALCTFGLAATAAAQDAPYGRLIAVNDALNAARLVLPEVVGGDVASEGEAIAAVERAVLLARHDLTAELRAAEPMAYDEVAAGLADLEGWLSHLRISHACNEARLAILLAHAEGRRASASDFAQLDAAIATFADKARPEGSSDVAFYRTQSAKLRAADNEVEATAKARALEAAERARAARRAALFATAESKLAVLRQQNNALSPLSADAQAGLDDATRALGTEDAELAKTFVDHLGLAKLETAWGKASPAAETAIAAALGGSIASKGRLRAKSGAVKGKAKAGRCYLLLGRFEGTMGTESVEAVEWSTTPRSLALQEWRVPPRDGWKELSVEGVCATRSASFSAKVTLNVKPQKGLRYVLVEVGREAFPRAFAARLVVTPVDYCDAKAWADAWTQPVPGAFAYLEAEPVLIRRIGTESVAEVWTAGRPKAASVKLAELGGVAPAAVALRAPLEPATCPNDAELGPARGAASRKLVQCYAAVERKLAARQKKVVALRLAAEKEGRLATDAVELARQIDADRAPAREAACGTLVADAKRLFEETYQTLRAELESRRYQDPSGRVTLLQAFERARASAVAEPPRAASTP